MTGRVLGPPPVAAAWAVLWQAAATADQPISPGASPSPIRRVWGPWGIKVHPTQLYESLLALGVFLVLYHLRSRKRFDGQILGTYFLLAGLVRFGVEFYRGDPRGPVLLAGLPSTQVIALAMTEFGVCFLFFRWRGK